MKFMIVNGWHDDNRGDSAIVSGLIHLLRKTNKESEISILSEFHYQTDKKDYNRSTRFLKEDGITLFTSIFRGFHTKKIMNTISSYLKSFFLLVFPELGIKLYHEQERRSILELRASDVVISKGGHIFYQKKTFRQLLYFYKLAFPLLYARRLKKPYYLLAQSYGPFHSRLAKILMRILVNGSIVTASREEKSKECLASIKHIKQSKLEFMYDTAFYLEQEEIPDLDYLYIGLRSNKKKIAITIRQIQYVNSNEEIYLNGIRTIIDDLLLKGHEVYIIPHVTGPNILEDDRVISTKLYASYQDKRNVYYVNNNYSAKQLLTFYEKMDLTIGTRFHSIIFSLRVGTPILAISYSGYKSSIVNQFGLGKYHYQIEEMNESIANKMIVDAAEILARSELRQTIKTTSKEINRSLKRNIKLIQQKGGY